MDNTIKNIPVVEAKYATGLDHLLAGVDTNTILAQVSYNAMQDLYLTIDKSIPVDEIAEGIVLYENCRDLYNFLSGTDYGKKSEVRINAQRLLDDQAFVDKMFERSNHYLEHCRKTA